MGIETLLNIIKDYAPQDKQLIIRAYEFANSVHRGVLRKSGEPYIIHPIAVACILAEMHADVDTICAGLLHDVIEDGKGITKEYLAELFNPTIAYLVDGVTKLPKFGDQKSKGETDAFNRRKMIEMFILDIRIFIIKLADRLHNMRTLEYHKPNKQIENAQETRDIFVPFAHKVGAYEFKHELEDLSFKYLEPANYSLMQKYVENASKENFDVIESAICQVSQMLNSNNIPFDIKLKFKSLYGLYRKLSRYDGDLSKIHDLITITVLLEDMEKCYYLRDQINMIFDTVPEKSKDYIIRPKSNLYSSLHTTVMAPNNQMIQFKINTEKMHLINSYGISAYWDLHKFNYAPEHMQEDVKKMPFYNDLQELMTSNLKNEEFNEQVQADILSDTLYLKTPEGDTIELPIGSTPVDFAYKIHADIGNGIISAIVNGERVPLDYELQPDDNVHINFDNNLYGPRVDTLNMCKTKKAKRKIREYRENCKKY
ncbi:MAG: bifunctional (p)ppGpp synthetase/guanosine-3',5'-bis(diphosphate) 3'-pyrophosphohydrolase [Erysipelotrichales bacterium]|nr:bifunctional (p)ppGpp synthetase/guanosine-3',5'-bis(diphosphate) 3'-pyrophosphohydrolase [Erysipelotrichales bacterium]